MSEAEKAEKKKGWRWGVNRWLVLAVIIIGVWITGLFPPARPAIFLPPEAVIGTAEQPLFYIGSNPFYITNTIIATILADIFVLLVVIFGVVPAYRKGKIVVPKGIAGVFDGLSEIFYNLTETTAGKWTRSIFPWFAAISVLVLVMNWMELLPGVDSIGVFSDHHAEAIEHYEEICNTSTFSIGSLEVVSIWASKDHPESVGECAHAIIPYVRAVATDLNFTVALAMVSVVMIQVIGVRALGLRYFEKFVYVRTLFTKPFFGLIDFFVGLFEIVSEFSKIISFSFRLFGNIFAGMVLLFVLGTLIPVIAQAGVLMLEFMVGLIQAIVFGMLTMIFMSQATQSHHGDGNDHH